MRSINRLVLGRAFGKAIDNAGDHIHSLVQRGVCRRLNIKHTDIAVADHHKGQRDDRNTGAASRAESNIRAVGPAGRKTENDLGNRDQDRAVGRIDRLTNYGVHIHHFP